MKNKRTKTFIYSFLIALLIFAGARLYYNLTDDFRLGNITYDMTGKGDWQTPRISQQEQEKLVSILNQKFYYIGKGAQCYAFGSEDGKYVLKFFKFKHLKPHWLVDLIPSLPLLSDYKKTVAARKKKKLESVFVGYELAYRENKEDSKLIYLHLAPTNYLNQVVTVIDKIGRERQINLDDVVFLVQNKGEILRTRMHRYLGQNQLEAAKLAIGNIMEMYVSEYKRGLYDRDHGVMHNTGFVEDQPFHLDVGKFTKDENMKNRDIYKNDLEHIVWKIAVWTQRQYPQYYEAISDYLAHQYLHHTGYTIDISKLDPKKFQKKK